MHVPAQRGLSSSNPSTQSAVPSHRTDSGTNSLSPRHSNKSIAINNYCNNKLNSKFCCSVYAIIHDCLIIVKELNIDIF